MLPLTATSSKNRTYSSPDSTPSGTAVPSSTYLGGTGNDGLNTAIIENYGDAARGEVVVDPSNNIYVTASTNSTNFPSTNCTRCLNAGSQDAVVFKLNASGTSLLWSNYYGSTSDDAGYSLKYHNGAVFITGGTKGGNLPSTSGGFKSSYGGNLDGYLAKFNASTSVLYYKALMSELHNMTKASSWMSIN